MDQALHPLTVPRRPQAFSLVRRLSSFGLAPALTVLVFTLPILAGLLGTLLPAFGYLPALGSTAFSLEPWRVLLQAPGVATALQLTLLTGWLATGLSLLLAVSVVAFVFHRRWAARLGASLAPVLAMPHSALAIGLAFVITPSGWLVRWVSPGLTGWDLPPDIATVGHASGWPLVLALLLKEVPYLVLMLLGALNQVPARAQVQVARSLGYGPVQAWFDVVLPQVYRQIRLPVLAVLAFSLSVVDVALILGPGNPPTLAVLVVRWLSDPDTRWIFPASAAAVLLLGVVAGSILLWQGAERLVGHALVARLSLGRRSPTSHAVAGGLTMAAGLLLSLALLAMAGLTLWSFAAQWRFPDVLPSVWTWSNWQRQAASLAGPAVTTVVIGAASTLIALVLVLACLEHEARHPGLARPTSVSLLYLPLLVPQVAFLFGVQVLLVRIGADGHVLAVIAAHLVFVLPYLFLSLGDPWRAFDTRYARTAASLGASRWRVLLRVKLPILLEPVLMACAVAFAVSAGQYLPTLFAGAGRVATLTTEAVTLSGGADRRVIGTWALLQAVFPLLVFLLAARLPQAVYRHRTGLG
jgi:putative thiamine transport system permease protein